MTAISDMSNVIPTLTSTLGVVFAEFLNGRSVSDYIYIVRAFSLNIALNALVMQF